MKRYLISLYGLTDLSVAMGLESTIGMLFNYLLVKEYTELMIIYITNYDKKILGGLSKGRAVSALCFNPNSKIVRKKIADSKNLQVIYGNHFFKQIETIIH